MCFLFVCFVERNEQGWVSSLCKFKIGSFEKFQQVLACRDCH